MQKRVVFYVMPCGHPIKMDGEKAKHLSPEKVRCFKCRREKGEGGTAESDKLVRLERAFIAANGGR